METTPAPPSRSNNSWLIYLFIVGLIVGGIVWLTVSAFKSKPANSAYSSEAMGKLRSGDFYIKIAQTEMPGTEESVSAAIELYQKAGSIPAAYRRIGVAKETLLHKPGLKDLESLSSTSLSKTLPPEQTQKLESEEQMWAKIFGKGSISHDEAQSYISRIEKANLGPLKANAIAFVYKKAGESAKAKAATKEMRENALASAATLGLIGILGIAAFVAGIAFNIIFLTSAGDLKHTPKPRIQPTVLLISFLTYFIGWFLLQFLIGAAAVALGINGSGMVETALLLVFDLLGMAGAYALGMSVFRMITAITGEDAEEIGLRFKPVFPKVALGGAAYCATLPLVIASALISQLLFKHINTPEHPITSMLSQGWLPLALVFVIAVVAAPIVEETFFRGMLYTALRGKMGAWGAAGLSSFIFAIIHPTFPGQFLMLFMLAMVLAMVREKSGSLLPGMVCHAINNAITLLVALLLT